MPRTSRKADQFSESVIREMTRLAALHSTPERPVINLAQGFPDFPAPTAVKEAARDAIDRNVNQYAITWGSLTFRSALADKYARHYDWTVNPETELTVTCGATEGMIASLLAVLDPGDEVVVFEPFYENYGPDAVLSGAVPARVPLERVPEPASGPASGPGSGLASGPASGGGFALDGDRLRAAITPRTRGLILNSPNNPTGKVFDADELALIRDVCVEHDLVAFTDEIYEHIIYDGATHVPLATLEGMAERTCTVNALSKTYSVTGWRVGWVLAPPAITAGVRKVHDFLTVGAPAPLQEAGAVAAAFDDDYYRGLAGFYRERRDYLLAALGDAGLRPLVPQGAYYTMADCSPFAASGEDFARRLVSEVGVACVPGSSFYAQPRHGASTVRFSFCKQMATLEAAAQRLAALADW